ncbi:MAG: GreA/GreB family elongation factor [Anaerolineae bacterium]
MKDMSNVLERQDKVLPDEGNVVKVHSHVTVYELGEEFSYQIVEPHEVDVPNKRISRLSPVARALLGKRVGDKVVVQAPGGVFEFEIREIRASHRQPNRATEASLHWRRQARVCPC